MIFKTMRPILCLFVLAVIISGFSLFSGPSQAENIAVTDAERAKMESVIKDYLLNNPDIVMESLQKYQQNQRANVDREFSETFGVQKEKLLKAGHPSIGPANADVTIFEFYDYNCGYCKKAFEDVAKLVEEDKNLRFIFIEMPILSETSIEAAKWSIAADKQGKFFAFHSILMKHNGSKDKESLEKIAGELKMDLKKAAIDSESKESLEMLEGNLKFARDMGINGTPAFIIGDRLTPGYLGYDEMKRAIAAVREQKKKSP